MMPLVASTLGAVIAALAARLFGEHGINALTFTLVSALVPLLVLIAAQSRSVLATRRGSDGAGPGRGGGEHAKVWAVPPGAGYFIGREALLTRIESEMSAAAAQRRRCVVNLYGAPGVGTTSLGAQLARRLASNYADGVLWISLRREDGEILNTQAAMADLIRQAEEGGNQAPEVVLEGGEWRARYHKLLGSGHYLVVVDDVDAIEQIEELFPQPSCTMIVLSRYRLAGAALTDAYQVEGFDDDEALAFLTEIADADRIGAEPAAAREIVRLCGNMPLALSIAGARLAQRPYWSLASFAERLRDKQHGLDELRVGGTAVRDSLRLSYGDLTAIEQQAFRRLGMLTPVIFSAWVLAPLLDVSFEQAEEIAGRLSGSYLIDEAAGDSAGRKRYTMHELVKRFAAEKSAEEPESERRAAVERLAAMYLSILDQMARRAYPAYMERRDRYAPIRIRQLAPAEVERIAGPRPLRWLAAESHGLVATLTLAKSLRLIDLCWQVSVVVFPFFEVLRSAWGRWELPLDLLQMERSWIRAESGRMAQWECAVVHQIRGALLMSTDRFQQAEHEYRAAQETFIRIDDPIGVAESGRGLGEVLRMLGRYSEAVDYLQEVLNICREANDQLGQARTLLDLGNCHRIVHLDADAGRELAGALAIFTRLGDDFERARALRALGNLHRQRGELDESDRRLREALRIFESFEISPGDSYWAACTGYVLGKLHLERGEHAQAAEQFESTLQAFGDEHGSMLWVARARRQLAKVRLREGRPAQAQQNARVALELCDRLGLDFWRAHAQRTLGEALLSIDGRRGEGEELLIEAKEGYERLGNSWYAADVALVLANALPPDRSQEAIALLRDAFSTFGKIDDRKHQLATLDQLAKAANPTARPPAARRPRAGMLSMPPIGG